MRFLKNIFRDLYLYLLWAVAAWIIVGFVFSRITNTSADKKITLCVDAKCETVLLAAKLEEKLPDGIKMIKVRSFDYFLFDNGELSKIDFFIIPESEISKYVGGAMSIEKLMDRYPDKDFYLYDGTPVGMKVHTAGQSDGVASEYIKYGDESYYLLFNGGSGHSAILNDSADNKAHDVLDNLLKIK